MPKNKWKSEYKENCNNVNCKVLLDGAHTRTEVFFFEHFSNETC